MKDFYMGAVVEVEELALGENPPQDTPPQGVIVTRQERDGWTRRYLYRSFNDLSGKRVESEVLYSEARPQGPVPPAPSGPADPPAEMGRQGSVPIPFQGMGTKAISAQPVMDTRLNFPPGSQVRLAGRPVLGQAAPAVSEQPAAPAAAPLPFSQAPAAPVGPVAPAPAAPPALPAICDRAIQLPDGTIINPDDALTFKDFCALVPYIQKPEKQGPPGPGRPGTIPLSQGFGAVPSFGPSGSPFGQGGGGGGGGGGPAGPGPVGVVNNPQIGGAGAPGTSGPPGPAGPAGPPGAGSAIDGAQIVTDFNNAGAMAIVPGSTFMMTVGGDGKCVFEISAVLSRILPRASIWNVEAGIQIDATQYKLWGNSEQQGAGSDQAFILTIAASLYIVLPPGTYTVSMIYGYNAALNGWAIEANPSQPASISCKHS